MNSFLLRRASLKTEISHIEKYKLDKHKHMWRKAGENKGGHIKSMQSSKNVKNALWRRKQVENL